MSGNLEEERGDVAPSLSDSSPGQGRVSSGSGTARLAVVLALVGFPAVAYRALPLWDPGRPGIPDTTRFFFNWSDTAPQIVYIVAALLVYCRRRELFAAAADPARPWLSVPFLALAVVLFCWARHAGAVDLELVSLLFLAPGAALLLFGARFARLLTLPLVVLAFAIPPPGILANHVLLFLRLRGAEDAAWLLQAAGFSAFAEGAFIHTGPGTSEVVDSCSGLRSMQVLTLLAVAWTSFFSARVPHAVVLIASAPFIAYALNVVRITFLALHPGSDLSTMHSVQGVVIFLVGLGILALFDEGLTRVWPATGSRGDQAPVPARSREPDPSRLRFALALAALLLAMACGSYLIPQWDDGQARADRVRLPDRIGDWQFRRPIKLPQHFLGSVAFGGSSYRAYERDGEVISVFVGYDDRRRRERSLLSPIHAFARPDWQVEERAPRSIAGLPDIEAVLVRDRTGRALSYWWVVGSEGLAEEVLRAWLATDQSFWRRPEGAFVVRLTAEVEPRAGALEAAERSLQEFSRLLAPTLKTPPPRTEPIGSAPRADYSSTAFGGGGLLLARLRNAAPR